MNDQPDPTLIARMLRQFADAVVSGNLHRSGYLPAAILDQAGRLEAAQPAVVTRCVDNNVEAVRTMLRERAELGLAKLGVTTERTDLGTDDWLRHVQQELMDAAVYIQAALSKEECPDGCDGQGTIRGEDNGGDGSPQYPIYEVLRDCPVCAKRQPKAPTTAPQ